MRKGEESSLTGCGIQYLPGIGEDGSKVGSQSLMSGEDAFAFSMLLFNAWDCVSGFSRAFCLTER